MKIGSDFIMVRVESTLNTFLGTIKDENGKDVKLIINPNWKPTHHVRICGEVIAVPTYLTGRDNPLYEKYPGSPKPMAYRSHDDINQRLSVMPKHYRDTAQVPYMCGKYVPDFQTHFGVDPEIKEGDLAYFHYNSLLNEDNFLYQEPSGDLVYLIHYSNLFCYVRQGNIRMLNAYVLVSQYRDEEEQEIKVGGSFIFGKLKGNLVTEIGSKPKYLTGIVEHIGAGIGDDVRQTVPGALVVFRPSSEFINTIENNSFYAMKQWDLLAEWLSDSEIKDVQEQAILNNVVIEFNKIIPIGDYVMISPDDQPVSKTLVTHVFDPNAPSQSFKPGEIFVPATIYSHEKKKKIHNYGVGEVILQGELCKKNFVGEKVAFEKSSFYIWLDEFKVVLVRFGDIYGKYEKTNNNQQNPLEETGQGTGDLRRPDGKIPSIN